MMNEIAKAHIVQFIKRAFPKCPDDFTLLCSYPRRQLNCAPEWYREYGSSVQDPANIPTFRACGFDNSLVVLVQDNDA
uniref:Uncharacterized protein n=1 Tax=Parascaris equorum TaxID=6256 RepID=A0A914RE73_PAREQ